MKITAVRSWSETIALTQSFTISYHTSDDVTLHFLEIEAEGKVLGYGSASPGERVTGETDEACAQALQALSALQGEDLRHLLRLLREAQARMQKTPAALAALDMALHDLLARHLGVPLVEMLGRAHQALPTSNTLGLRTIPETLDEALRKSGEGFSVLKVKLGKSLEEDLERLAKLREVLPLETVLRVDPNQGYTLEELRQLLDQSKRLRLEFVEQPLKVVDTEQLRQLSPEQRQQIALDESLKSEADALRYGHPERYCGIYNIKLMKSGGLEPARRIAHLAAVSDIELMWGCNDESRISLAAALHQALACPNTRYLDLDGNLDLVRDPASGGYSLKEGVLIPSDAPGLGITMG
jgi:L-alanine-DL-glutamate epimerase-like enolase superfamily enzyme